MTEKAARGRVVPGALAVLVLAVMMPGAVQAAPCEDLATLRLARARVSAAESVAPGRFPAPVGRGGAAAANPFANLPAFCRVAATLQPSPRSAVGVEVWLPLAGWNGKLQVVGNGAFAGTISYPAMATALAAGYAAASTDTGHTGPASNTFVNQDVLLDFADRAVHETTVSAKQIVDAFYGRLPQQAYFNGCSTGGRQALAAAQRHPGDFTGIIAGAPAIHGSTQAFGQIWIYQATADAASALGREHLTLLHDAVLKECDALDGVSDGVLENPLACRFDPQRLACSDGADAGSCLSPPQVEAVRRIYGGAVNTKTGRRIFPGLEPGSELGWSPAPVSYAVDYFKHVVFKNPAWDPKTLDFDTDPTQATLRDNQILDATDANLDAYTGRGGKLLIYQGWAEQGIPPRNIVSYYEQVQQQTRNAAAAVRLFMVPGMGHCGGGDGTSTFDMVTALDRWVTTGTAPARIDASRLRAGNVDRTRPLCPWPQVAAYRGAGSTDDAANFVCR